MKFFKDKPVNEEEVDEDEDLNRNLDLEPCQIRQLGVYLRMLNICDKYPNFRYWHIYVFLLILYKYGFVDFDSQSCG